MGGRGPWPTLLFKLDERAGYDARDGVGTREGDERASYFAHDADRAAAVDEVDAVLVEGFAEGFRGGDVGGRGTGGGAAAFMVLVDDSGAGGGLQDADDGTLAGGA